MQTGYKETPWGDAKAIKVQSNYLYKPLDLFWLSFSCFQLLNILLVQDEIERGLHQQRLRTRPR